MRERVLKERTATTTNSTVNYDLPQWNGEDVTSWMTNLNDAFNKIDSAMWENHTAMAVYDKIASDLQKLADDLRVDNSEIRETLGSIQIGMGEQLAQLNQAKQDITNANIAITQLQQEDNVLSAMVEDLRDDIGMLSNRFKWRVKAYASEGFKFTQNGNFAHLFAIMGCGNTYMLGIRTEKDLPISANVNPRIPATETTYNEVLRVIKKIGMWSDNGAWNNCVSIPTALYSGRNLNLYMNLNGVLHIDVKGSGETIIPANTNLYVTMIFAEGEDIIDG